jgi:hypothetical protein
MWWKRFRLPRKAICWWGTTLDVIENGVIFQLVFSLNIGILMLLQTGIRLTMGLTVK